MLILEIYDHDTFGSSVVASSLRRPKTLYSEELSSKIMAIGKEYVAPFEGRTSPPCHLLFKVDSFPSLLSASVSEISSSKFEAQGYKWRLLICPGGNKTKDIADHISIYLQMLETTSLAAGWEVCVTANFFLYNKLQDKYLGKNAGVGLRYHSINTVFGIDQFIDLKTFLDPRNGYLFEKTSTCVFGVEVFTLNNHNITQDLLSVRKDPMTYSYTWKIDNFSHLVNESYVSEPFGHHKWYIRIYPNGHLEGEGNNFSIFLEVPSSIPSNTSLLVRYVMRIKDQRTANHYACMGENVFGGGNSYVYGWKNFLALAKLQNYLVDDTLIIEVEATLRGILFTKPPEIQPI